MRIAGMIGCIALMVMATGCRWPEDLCAHIDLGETVELSPGVYIEELSLRCK